MSGVLQYESASNRPTPRGRATPAHRARPRAYEVTAPRTRFSEDITYVWSPIRGQYVYLYVLLDVFSRKIVGADVHAEASMRTSRGDSTGFVARRVSSPIRCLCTQTMEGR
jgi:transposase InsO family protein